MKQAWLAVVLVVVSLALVGITSCDQLAIKGKVAGTVMTPDGSSYGMTTVVLLDTKTNEEADRENTSEMGSFIVDNVMPGEYKIQVLGMGGNEIALLEPITFKLGSGMTKNLKIIVNP